MTSPHQGNYGTNREDPESARVRVAGFAVREASRRASQLARRPHPRTTTSPMPASSASRASTRARSHCASASEGAMRCGVSTEDLDPRSLVARVRESPGMAGADLATGRVDR